LLAPADGYILAYELTAIIGYETVVRSLSERIPEIRTTVLQEGLALIPVTQLLTYAVAAKEPDLPANAKIPDFSSLVRPAHLTRPLVAFLQESSAFGPLIYCEAEYHGGAGAQMAIVWQQESIILGPLFTRWGQFGQAFNKIKLEDLAINTALRRIGLRPQRGKDEFEIVGLGRKNHTDEWC
jgi:hypothetical protein